MPSSVAPDSFPIFRLRARAVKDPRPTELPGRTRSQQPRNSLAGSDQPSITSRVVSPGQTVRVKSTGLPRRSS